MTGLSLGLAFAMTVQAQEAKLKIGDPAPKLQVAKWVQGDPVTAFEKDKAYIVEFWATWCGPCRVSIPHLNELHAKFKDKGLVVIGQDVWERDESLVEPFVKKMGDKMTYRVALDDKSKEDDGAMAMTWMKAAGQSGIPSAFVVNKQGKIAWIGHPMSLKEQILEDILADRFDLAKAAAEKAQEEANRAQLMDLSKKLNSDMRQKNWEDAEKTVGEMEKLLPAGMRSGMAMTRFQILTKKGDYDAAYKVVSELSDSEPDNAMLQNQLAWTIVSSKDLEKRDLTLAEKIAERANKAAQGKDPNILDTLARAQFMNGKKSQAIQTEQKAVELADEEMKPEFKKYLESYKAGKLPEVNQ
jgi:thiol-disulfide isomerase/thioredoxin